MALLLSSCAPARTITPSLAEEQEYIDLFLTAWIIERRPHRFLHPSFDVPAYDVESSKWPGALRHLAPRVRALDFPTTCFVGESPCLLLTDCVRAPAATTLRPYHVERYRVTETITTDFPSLRDLLVQDVIQVTFVLADCGVAAYVVIDTASKSEARVRSITYMAP